MNRPIVSVVSVEGEGKMTDRGSLTQLRLWLQESIEFEDYLINKNLSVLTPRIQRACWRVKVNDNH